MNYDRILLELMDRIQSLEEQVAQLQSQMNSNLKAADEIKTTTSDIREYIMTKISAANLDGEGSLVLRANDIHKALCLKSRFPMVCNAMRQCMKEGDRIVHETASGYSSSLEIEYFCGE